MRERMTGGEAKAGEGTLGIHLLVDAWKAPAGRLDDACRVRAAVVAAAETIGAAVLDVHVHRFSPRGVTVVATLAESHLAVHTWPELGYFAADLFYCGAGDVETVTPVLTAALGALDVRVRRMPRGPAIGEAEVVAEGSTGAPSSIGAGREATRAWPAGRTVAAKDPGDAS